MHIELKKLFDRIETYIVITICLLAAALSLLASNASYPISAANVLSSYQAAMIYGGGFSEMFSGIIMPACAVLPFVDSYFMEKRHGSLACSLTRQSRAKHIGNKALVVFFSSISVVFIAYFVNQMLCFIAYPSAETRGFIAGNIYNNPVWQEVMHTPNPSLYMNNKLFLNFTHIGYACLYAGAIALLGYSLSLYIYKNKAVANLLPIAIPLIWTFVGFYVFGVDYAPTYGILSSPTYSVSSLLPSIIMMASVCVASIVGILLRCYHFKDEL